MSFSTSTTSTSSSDTLDHPPSGSAIAALSTGTTSGISSGNPVPPSSTINTAAAVRLPNPPTFIEHCGLRFLVMDAPTDNNLGLYLRVTDVVRVCEPTYNKRTLEDARIRVHDWLFPDGEGPSDAIIGDWLRLVDSLDPGAAVACHCVAGLGRAPVLVAIALIEQGMSPLDAISFIRERRRGAINNRQLKFLEAYRPYRTRSSSRCAIF